MAIGGINHSTPVSVNGFSCSNCSEVDLAAKGVDPKHPKSGPFNRDAASDASRQPLDLVKLAAVQRYAATALQNVVGYSMVGAMIQPVAAGSAFSMIA